MKTKIAELTDKREDSMEQCMVFFSCGKKSDEANPEGEGEHNQAVRPGSR